MFLIINYSEVYLWSVTQDLTSAGDKIKMKSENCIDKYNVYFIRILLLLLLSKGSKPWSRLVRYVDICDVAHDKVPNHAS